MGALPEDPKKLERLTREHHAWRTGLHMTATEAVRVSVLHRFRQAVGWWVDWDYDIETSHEERQNLNVLTLYEEEPPSGRAGSRRPILGSLGGVPEAVGPDSDDQATLSEVDVVEQAAPPIPVARAFVLLPSKDQALLEKHFPGLFSDPNRNRTMTVDLLASMFERAWREEHGEVRDSVREPGERQVHVFHPIPGVKTIVVALRAQSRRAESFWDLPHAETAAVSIGPVCFQSGTNTKSFYPEAKEEIEALEKVSKRCLPTSGAFLDTMATWGGSLRCKLAAGPHAGYFVPDWFLHLTTWIGDGRASHSGVLNAFQVALDYLLEKTGYQAPGEPIHDSVREPKKDESPLSHPEAYMRDVLVAADMMLEADWNDLKIYKHGERDLDARDERDKRDNWSAAWFSPTDLVSYGTPGTTRRIWIRKDVPYSNWVAGNVVAVASRDPETKTIQTLGVWGHGKDAVAALRDLGERLVEVGQGQWPLTAKDPASYDPPMKRFTVKKHKTSGGYVVWDTKVNKPTGSHEMKLEQAEELAETMERLAAERGEPVRDSGPSLDPVQAEIARRVAAYGAGPTVVVRGEDGVDAVHDPGCACGSPCGKKMKRPERRERRG